MISLRVSSFVFVACTHVLTCCQAWPWNTPRIFDTRILFLRCGRFFLANRAHPETCHFCWCFLNLTTLHALATHESTRDFSVDATLLAYHALAVCLAFDMSHHPVLSNLSSFSAFLCSSRCLQLFRHHAVLQFLRETMWPISWPHESQGKTRSGPFGAHFLDRSLPFGNLWAQFRIWAPEWALCASFQGRKT